jgi:TRAP-type C4-dicarboxylate transport system substrate-binding protein
MHKRGLLKTSLLTALTLGLLLVCAPQTTWSQTVNWKYYGFTALRNPVTQLMVDFAKEAKTLTKVKIDIRVFSRGELPYEPSDAVAIASKGLVQLANTEVSYIAGEVPISPLISMPLMIRTKDEALKAGHIFIPYLDKAIQKKYNAKILWWYAWPPRKIMGKGDAPKSLADLKGKRIRFPGPIGSEFLVRLGMVPVNVNPGDVATALQRGTLDGTSGAYVYLQATKWYEVCNWAYDIDAGGVFNLTLINKSVYDKLPANLKTALNELANKYIKKATDLGFQLEGKAVANFKKAGIKFVEPSSADLKLARKKMVPFWSQWASQKGPQAAKALNEVRQAIGK